MSELVTAWLAVGAGLLLLGVWLWRRWAWARRRRGPSFERVMSTPAGPILVRVAPGYDRADAEALAEQVAWVYGRVWLALCGCYGADPETAAPEVIEVLDFRLRDGDREFDGETLHVWPRPRVRLSRPRVKLSARPGSDLEVVYLPDATAWELRNCARRRSPAAGNAGEFEDAPGDECGEAVVRKVGRDMLDMVEPGAQEWAVVTGEWAGPRRDVG